MEVQTIPPTATVRVAEDVLASAFEEELVILNLRDGVYYGLEGVGTRIWALVQQPASLTAIRDALVAEYDVNPARCEADLRSLLTDLAKRGLVVVKAAP